MRLCAALRKAESRKPILRAGFPAFSPIRGAQIDRVRYPLNWKTRRHQFISIHLRTGTVCP